LLLLALFGKPPLFFSFHRSYHIGSRIAKVLCQQNQFAFFEWAYFVVRQCHAGGCHQKVP
jgi:hypothetical protein